ncbi:MAG: cobalamin-binding protein [Candidatus Scalindua sp. AMX11]|nr:MAG: cobalamin-binding protein [Candidatus Scalindua sp.]TDE65272.1 MAG: cobalamin-binding protein [Candidatus Scalindua sp. AMX11]
MNRPLLTSILNRLVKIMGTRYSILPIHPMIFFVNIKIMNKNLHIMLLSVFWIILTICNQPTLAESENFRKTKTFIDDTQFSLHFDNPPKRIISVSPSITEILGVIDADSMLVGVSLYSYYPSSVKGLPKVGSYVKPNIEQIISLNPDLVVMSFDGAPRSDVNKLRKLNINVAVLRSEKFSDIINNINWLGEVLQHQKEAKEVARNLVNRYEQIRSLVKEIQKPTAFYSIALNPIISVGSKSFINDLIHDAGGVNITGDIDQAYPKLTIESIIARSPDILLFSSGMGNELSMEGQLPFWQRWKNIPAIRDQRFIEIDHDIINRPGPRVVMALALLAQQFHPEKAEVIQRIMKNEKP